MIAKNIGWRFSVASLFNYSSQSITKLNQPLSLADAVIDNVHYRMFQNNMIMRTIILFIGRNLCIWVDIMITRYTYYHMAQNFDRGNY